MNRENENRENGTENGGKKKLKKERSSLVWSCRVSGSGCVFIVQVFLLFVACTDLVVVFCLFVFVSASGVC